jgi:ATP-dependent Lon protease
MAKSIPQPESEEVLALSAEDLRLRELPLLPLRNTVIFPVLTVPLSVGRPRSVAAVEQALEGDKLLVVVAQRDADVDDPGTDELYQVGVLARVVKLIKLADGNQSLVVQGLRRIRIRDVVQERPHLKVRVEVLDEAALSDVEVEALMLNLKGLAKQVIDLSPTIPDEAHVFIEGISDPSVLADMIASNLRLSTEEKQELLEQLDLGDRLRRVIDLLQREVQVLDLSQKIKTEVRGEIDKNQREYFLREQLKAIRRELGEDEAAEAEVEDLKESIEARNLPQEAKAAAFKELKRLERTPQQSPEWGIIRTYLDWLVDLPWADRTEDNLDLAHAKAVLDEDHYDLEKVKKRILEYLAVLKLKEDMKGPILCLVGPPGVGKTSLGRSVARALGRKFVRMSLGGVRDEAEVRGHRRTYIGALPGRVLQGMKKAGTINPVFILDEIDKVGTDFRGDPSSALLEVLDPEQNNSFSDHYLEVSYDLSKVMFIATANRLDTIPPALLDRMEVIDLSGYTQAEKLQIARKYIVPEEMENHGLKAGQVEVLDEALELVIDGYTREAGVRNLKREVAGLMRGAAREILESDAAGIRVDAARVEGYLGPRKFFQDLAEQLGAPGVAIGMAWTPVGGDILFIEATKMPGKGHMQLTGKLGDVMKESAQLALSYIRANGEALGLGPNVTAEQDFHVHVPEGAIPKDGPSAGVTMLTALTSLLTGRRVRSHVAMTGEITLRGNVLPVGGIKEKVIAASRAGIREVILPARNEKDLIDVAPEIRDNLKFHFVTDMRSVLDVALEPIQGSGKATSRRKSATKSSSKQAAGRAAKP